MGIRMNRTGYMPRMGVFRSHSAALFAPPLAIAFPGEVAPVRAQGVESHPTRSIRIATKEVADPDVAVSSDGRWLVFTALGHLFQLPAEGGATKQLTSGPFYDAAPAISPDGTKVAFVFDRKVSSQGNIVVLDIASGRISQVTDEFWVDRPVWSPDGKSLAFLSYQRVGPVGNYWFIGPGLLKSQVRRVGLADGKVQTLTEPGFVHVVAFLRDGRPLWSAVEPETKGKPGMSRLSVLSRQGVVTTALMVEGVVDRMPVDPGNARGLYLRLYKTAAVSVIAPQPEHLAYVTLTDGRPRTVTGLLSRPADPTRDVEDHGADARVYVAPLSNPLPRPAFGAANGTIYLGEKGKLWRVHAATGKRAEVTFSADIAFDFYSGSQSPVYSEKRPTRSSATNSFHSCVRPSTSASSTRTRSRCITAPRSRHGSPRRPTFKSSIRTSQRRSARRPRRCFRKSRMSIPPSWVDSAFVSGFRMVRALARGSASLARPTRA